ncbi:MAG: hypothetical protein CSB48_10935 [Proteobacteria bacterium]|nr:MAG: hypothetical protein CSB48_10935 [Pseudomonadota bacterium]PIE40055.1 MAG: hypothetical protein CSA51_02700 [Gammaproteobacteria bacterium]
MVSKEKIRIVAGEQVFLKGEAFAANHPVRELDLSKNRAVARIGQSPEYLVKLNFSTSQLQGACSCADSDGFDFCLHCVAVALEVARQLRKRNALTQGNDRDKVMAYLQSLDKHALATLALDFISQDPQTFNQYLLKAHIGGSQIDYPAIRKQITELTRLPGKLFTQKQIRLFFTKIREFVQTLQALEEEAEPPKLAKLIDYFYQRLNLVLDKQEDYRKHHELATIPLENIYLNLKVRADERPEALARNFFADWLADRHNLRSTSLSRIEHLIGSEEKYRSFMATFNSLCLNKWQALPDINPDSISLLPETSKAQTLAMYQRLQRHLLETGQSGHSPLTRLEIRTKAVMEYRDYYSLARSALDCNKPELAILFYKQFLDHCSTVKTANTAWPFDPDDRVTDSRRDALNQLCQLFCQTDSGEEALPYLWQQFMLTPGKDLLDSILRIARKSSLEEESTWQGRARDFVAQSCANSEGTLNLQAWQLLTCQDPATATTLANRLNLDSKPLAVLAESLLKTDPQQYRDQIITLFKKAARLALAKGNASGYREAENCLDHLERLTGNCDPRFITFIRDLLFENRHKRTMVAMLRTRFETILPLNDQFPDTF